jgi:hypothetical protein
LAAFGCTVVSVCFLDALCDITETIFGRFSEAVEFAVDTVGCIMNCLFGLATVCGVLRASAAAGVGSDEEADEETAVRN